MKINLWYDTHKSNGLMPENQSHKLEINSYPTELAQIGDFFDLSTILHKMFRYSPNFYKSNKPVITNNFINEDIFNEVEINIYPIVFTGLFDLINGDETFINKMSHKSIDLIAKNKLRLVLGWGTEAWNFPLYELKIIEEKLINVGINPKNVLFISGNGIIEDHIDTRMKNENISLNFQFKGFNFWEFYTRYEILNCIGLPKIYQCNISIQEKNIKKKLLLNLNANIKWHRLALVSILKNQTDIFEKSYISFVGRNYGYTMTADRYKNDPDLTYVIHDFFRKNDIDKNNFMNLLNNWKPITLDLSPTEVHNNDRKFQPFIYNDTLFSIISESEYVEDVLFVTEKTYKAIHNFHPFMIWGNPNVLQYLKSLGYETYTELFDESYDQERDNHIRLNKIRNNINNLNNLNISDYHDAYLSVKNKLIYNYELFLNRDMSEQTEQFVKILVN